MFCYKDMTFCGSDCIQHNCMRYFGAKQHAEATKWWGREDYPVAKADFSLNCDMYKAPEETTEEVTK